MTTLTQVDSRTLAVVACAVALVAVLVACAALRAASRVRTSAAAAGGLDTRRAGAAGDDAQVRARLTALEHRTATGLQHVAVVRYDAFGDMGGRLSFSAALLDDAGDGLVITSIHARGESRTYAKGVVGGTSEITLTPEELQAIEAAPSGTRTES